MRPAELQAQSALIRRWRSFPDVVTRPGFDGSVRAARRVGWKPPVAPLRAQHTALSLAPEAAAPPDTLRIAFIRIDFLHDRGGDASTGNGRFDLAPYDTTTPPIDPPPHDRRFFEDHLEALSRFYDVMSYGRTKVVGDVWPRQDSLAYHLTDMADLGPWIFSRDIYRVAVNMFQQMVLAADSQSTNTLHDRIPWDQYDRFMFIHAGSDLQSDVRQDSKEDIPSFTIGVVDTDAVRLFGVQRPISRASIVPERIDQDGYYGALNGVIAHENGHNCFGFEDLYNIETGFPVVGLWSLMDSGNLAGSRVLLKDGSEIFATGMLPPSVDAWQRFFTTDTLAFPEVLYGDTLQALQLGERHPDMRRVTLSSDEYLLLENRYIPPADTLIEFDQDTVTHVVLGPRPGTPWDYDALLPGTGILVWHIDTSVIPFESSLRINPDFGFNSDRLGISVVEGDGLQDLGDPGSPFIIGAPFDPWFVSNNPVLGDSTFPNLIPHIGTRPHRRLEFTDDPDPVMHFRARRSWALPAWPLAADFPPGGPQLLAIDADGDRNLEVCWAGGADSLVAPSGHNVANPDSAALFAIRPTGTGLDSTFAFAHYTRRPLQPLAAVGTGELQPGQPAAGPSLFAFTVPDANAPGGTVWLTDHHGNALPGWPLAIRASTPPVIVGIYPNIEVIQGTVDGGVCGFDRSGTLQHLFRVAPPGSDTVVGRIAASLEGSVLRIGAGTRDGWVGVRTFDAGVREIGVQADWSTRLVAGTRFDPDFLWIHFQGAATPPSLIAHHADRLWAFHADGTAMPGWGHTAGDTLVAGLGAGDPDGDGVPEVLTQSVHSQLTFWNRDGYPSPGWPRRATKEDFRTWSPPLALDVDKDGRSEVVGMNASGIIGALRTDGREPEGWPLATGSGATGAPVAADLNHDGMLDVVAPDRFGLLYAYATPVSLSDPVASAWTTLGGDAGRSAALPAESTPALPEAAAGPLVKGTLKAFPNPARRHAVHFAYTLSEPADVEFRIFDASGHQVTSFARHGEQTDNLEVWDPGNLPSGLYVARLRFRGAGNRERTEVLPVALLR
jgi:M6 family metalloprotease-like protein